MNENWSGLYLVGFVDCDSIFRSFMGCLSDQTGPGLGFVHFCELVNWFGVHFAFFDPKIGLGCFWSVLLIVIAFLGHLWTV